MIEKRKGLHPIVQVLEPECEQNSAERQVSDHIAVSSEDINRSEMDILSSQIAQDEKDMSTETHLRENGFGLLKSDSRSEFKGLELKENPKSGLIVFDFSKAHRDWKLTSERADTEDREEIPSLSEQCLLSTGADQIGEEGVELRSTESFNILMSSINSSILYSDWVIVLECADIQDQEEITDVIDLSLFPDADKDRNEDIESAENAITEETVAIEEKVVTEEPLDNVVNRLLSSYPIQRPKVRNGLLLDPMAHSSELNEHNTYGHNEEPLDSVVNRVLAIYPTQKPDVMLKFITDKEIPSTKEGNGTDNRILSGNGLDKTEEEVHFYYGFASNFHWNFSFIDRNRLFGRGLK